MAERHSGRNSLPEDPVHVRFGEFELDESNAQLLRDGLPVAIAPTPFALLCALARKPAALLTRHALLDQVWGHQFVSDSVLKTAISDLRSILNDDARRPRFIETVARRGYRFIAAPQATAPTPAPAIPEPQRQTGFIGRTTALARLQRGWDAACRGQRSLMWVAGEPGIGKTTLVEHFVSLLQGAALARGHCVESFGAGEPYLPVLEALAELCRRDDALPSLLRSIAPTWLVQLPWLSTAQERENLRAELVGVGSERMLREMAELLDRYTERRPLLLVTEDVHWSDRSTIQLMDYIARRRGSARLMWLSTFRLAEVVALDHPFNALRRELRLHQLCEEIVLDPFSEREVADFVAKRWPSIVPDEVFIRALHARTDGVPLFVASVVADVATQGGPDHEVEKQTQAIEVAAPENLTALIDHYIARLSDEQRTLLSAAAVCGMEFRVSTVAAVLERDAVGVAEQLEELARMQLWLAGRPAGAPHERAERPHCFRHALFRHVLYERTAAEARARLHRRVGQAFEREREAGVPASAAELAMHFERGRDSMTALRYYGIAAATSLARFSATGCMNLTEHALPLVAEVTPGPERDSLEVSLATLHGVSAFHLLGAGTVTKQSLERGWHVLAGVPRHPMRGLLAQHHGLVLCLRGEYDAALAAMESALALPDAQSDLTLLLGVRMVQGDVHFLRGQPRAACRLLESAVPEVEDAHAPPDQSFALVALLGVLAVHLVHLGRIGAARARLRDARERAGRLGQPMARLIALWFDALAEVRFADAPRVRTIADEMQGLVDQYSLAHGRAACRLFRGWADARLGKPTEGYREIRQGYEDNNELGMVAGGSESLAYAAQARLLAGDATAAQSELEEALQIVQRHGERVYLPQLLLLQGSIARARGESDPAHAAVVAALSEARAQAAPWLELLALSDLCEHHVPSAADRAALADLLERLSEARGIPCFDHARSVLAA